MTSESFQVNVSVEDALTFAKILGDWNHRSDNSASISDDDQVLVIGSAIP